MSDRVPLISALETARSSRVISYVTGDRQPFATKIGSDVVPLLAELLESVGRAKKISLFLYTAGGDMLTPIRIVRLIRNHCDTFEVLIPYKSHSAGTLICLGADKIVMGKLGELTPVDPSTGHPFNPPDPNNPQQKLEVSVEDLNSYLLFAKEKAGVEPDQMADVYRLLVESKQNPLHPLSIGNAYRAYRMARILAERLLQSHLNSGKDAKRIERIVNNLTGNITVHAYPIDRLEAKDLELKVESAKDDHDKKMRELYKAYEEVLKLNQPFTPGEVLSGSGEGSVQIERPGAYLESTDGCYEYIYKGTAQSMGMAGLPGTPRPFNINFESMSWIKR